jgi:hypothetical protein
MNYYRTILAVIFISLAVVVLTGEEKKPVSAPVELGSGLAERPAKKDKITVGQWVKYQVKRYRKDQPDNAPAALAEADIKISVVDKEVVIENEYLWVESVFNEGRADQRIVKLMVDKNGNPQAERLVLKYGKLPAIEIHLRIWEVKTRITREMLFDEMTSELNVIPFTRMLVPEAFDESSISYETLPVKFPSRKELSLNCVRVLLKQPESSKTDGYVWYSDKVPLAGLVKFMLIEDKYRAMILIQDYNHAGAQSLIKEAPIKLDFREKETEPQIDADKR